MDGYAISTRRRRLETWCPSAADAGPLQQLMEEDGWVGGRGVVTTDGKGRHIVELLARSS